MNHKEKKAMGLQSRWSLLGKAAVKFLSGFAAMCLLLFLPAGTFVYPCGWLLIGLLFAPMLFVGVLLLWKVPELLEKRLGTKETENDQKIVIALSSLEFLLCFVLAGLDFRFSWSHFGVWLTVAASAVFLTGYILYAEVMRENAFLSRTVEVQEGQKVIDTGLYALVRHPMYFATVLLFWTMPLVLGSWLAFFVMLPYPLLLVKRIRNEEKVLREGLTGYAEYCGKVRYRLIPFVW